MNDNSNAAAAMLSLDGFVLVEVSQQHGGLEQAVETSATEAFCATCGCAGDAARPAPGMGAGAAVGDSASDAGVSQAGVAVPGATLEGDGIAFVVTARDMDRSEQSTFHAKGRWHV